MIILLNKDISMVSGGLEFDCKILNGGLIKLHVSGSEDEKSNDMFELCCLYEMGEYWRGLTMYGECDLGLKTIKYPESGCSSGFPWKI